MKAEWMEQFAEAIEALDHHRACSLVQNRDISAKELLEFYEFAVSPLLKEIDHFEREGGIFKEHARTQLIMEAICHFEDSVFSGNQSHGPKRSNYKILMYSPEGEHHILGLRMMQDLISINGFETFFPGADMPNDQLKNLLAFYKPTHIIVSITNSYHLVKFKEAMGIIKNNAQGVVLIGTGRAFEANPTAISELILKSNFRAILALLGVSL